MHWDHEPPPHPPFGHPLPRGGGEGRGEGAVGWFKGARRAQSSGRSFHEPSGLRVADPRSGPRLCEAQRFMVPMRDRKVVEALHEPATSSSSSSIRPLGFEDEDEDEKDWVHGLNSHPNLWRCSLSMNPEEHRASNGSRNPCSLRRSMFDVRCSLSARGFHLTNFDSGEFSPSPPVTPVVGGRGTV